MHPFARSIVAYHGCEKRFADELLLGKRPIGEWQPSTNDWDWLGNGIYFWEHSPDRALRWARDRYKTRSQRPAVLGAVLQLGRCFDLLDESFTILLGETHEELVRKFAEQQINLPENRGRGGKLRDLDCLVINTCLKNIKVQGNEYDTVRGAFLEGAPVYPSAGFSRESHIQVSVRNSACILGVFRPNI